MSKKSKKTNPKGKTKPEPKPRRIKCPACGREYNEGAPHYMFCRGNVQADSECVCCGEENGDVLSVCSVCGDTVCDACKDNEDGSGHDCAGDA